MDKEAMAQRLRDAIAMADEGIELMRLNLQRQHPDEDDDAIDQRLRAWLIDRPLDAVGRPRPR